MYVIIYYDGNTTWSNEDGTINFSMLSLCNRSIAFHMIEQVLKVQEYSQRNQHSTFSIDKIIFISDDNPSLLRSHLGNGERWGCTIEVLPLLASLDDTIDVVAYSNSIINSKSMLIFTKLCIFNPQDLYNSIHSLLSHDQVHSYAMPKTKDVDQNMFIISKKLEFLPLYISYFEIQNLKSIAAATKNTLKGEYPWLLRDEKQYDDFPASQSSQHITDMKDIFIGTQCSIASDVRLYQPSIIGHNVHIGENCTIGPYACIGDFCIVDENTIIENSIISKNTYISPLVSIKNSYVIGQSITQIESDVCVITPNTLIEANKSYDIALLSQRHNKKVFFLKRVLCISLVWSVILTTFLCISPVILLQWILGKRSFAQINYTEHDEIETLQCNSVSKKVKKSIYIVSKSAPPWLHGPIMTFFPSIINVILRDIPLFGLSFIEHDCLQAVEWLKKKNYSNPHTNKNGLLPPWFGLSRAPMTSIEKYIHAIWYAHANDACVDCRILFGLLRYGWGHMKDLQK
ncbi:MAG: NDP-sugar synthase [Pseudomonadota bacterium]